MYYSSSQIHAKAAEECFEGISRSMFKFNMVFDDVILEPIAKGYNKLPAPLKRGTSNFTSNISTLLIQYQIIFYKVHFKQDMVSWKFCNKYNCWYF